MRVMLGVEKTMKRLLLIVNPRAGQRKAKRYLADIIEIFNRAGYSVLVELTQQPGDGQAICLRYAGQVDLIVCCGGDGTFNEIVCGVIKSGLDIPVGYIPAGSTNDFATGLGLSKNILQAARDILEGTPEHIDVGCFNGRYFSYIASFGAFTKTSYNTPQNIKNVFGQAAYLLGGIQEVSQLQPYPVRVELPEGRILEDSFVFGAITNCTSVGGVLTLDARQVDMTDGMFELLLIRTPKDLFELGECVRSLQQKDYASPMLTFQKAAELTVDPPEDMPWTLDGEQESGHNQVTVRCLHHAAQEKSGCVRIDSCQV